MHTLGFIHIKKSSPAEEELITDLWKMMGGTNENTIKAENLLMVLAAVMNLQVPEIFHNIQSENGHKVGPLSYDEHNNLYFQSIDDIFKVH